MLLIIGIIIWRSSTEKHVELGAGVKQVAIPILILIGIGIVANSIYSDFDYTFRAFRNMLVGLLIVIFIAAVTTNTKNLKILCGVIFVGITASAVVGIMQYYQFLGMGQNTLIPGFLTQTGGQLRVPGMAETELELSYLIPVVILAAISIFLVKGVDKSNKWLLVISLLPMGMALYFTFTRSALFALLLGLVALFLFFKIRIKGEFILVALLLAIVFVEATGFLEGQYLGGRATSAQEESSVSRKILWQAGLSIAMDNPILGIGGDQYTKVAPEYESNIDPNLLAWEKRQYFEYSTLGNEAIHNDFLYLWVSYGTLAIIVYLWLYFAILRNFLQSHQRSNNRFIKGLSIGLAAGLVAYGANAFYHNCLATLPLFWILAGLSVATAKLAVKGKS